MVNNQDVIVFSDDDEHMSSGDDGDNNYSSSDDGDDNMSSGDDDDNNYNSSDDGDDNMSSGDDGDKNYSSSNDDDNMSSGDDGDNNFSSSDDDENISSGDDGNNFSSTDDDNISTSENNDKVVYTIRAPNIRGRRRRVSIFANYMRLNPNQVQVPNNHANDYRVPPIKHYVFKMTKSSVVPGKSKMEFGKQFSNDYLNKFLDEPIDVVVNCNRSEEVKYVQMKKGEKKGKIGNAMMTTGWKQVVEEFNLRKGDICAFSFRDQSGTRFQDGRARLTLLIVPLDN